MATPPNGNAADGNVPDDARAAGHTRGYFTPRRNSAPSARGLGRAVRGCAQGARSSTTRCGTWRPSTVAGVNRSRASRRASGAAEVRRSWPPKLHATTAPLASTTNAAHSRGNAEALLPWGGRTPTARAAMLSIGVAASRGRATSRHPSGHDAPTSADLGVDLGVYVGANRNGSGGTAIASPNHHHRPTRMPSLQEG